MSSVGRLRKRINPLAPDYAKELIPWLANYPGHIGKMSADSLTTHEQIKSGVKGLR